MDAKTMIAKYSITLTPDGKLQIPATAAAKRDIETIRAAKAEIVAYLNQQKADEEAAKQLKAANLAKNVPGLAELRKAKDALHNDNARYHAQWERMMEDENNDGVNPPAALNKALHQTAYDLAAQYPRAAIYLKAEGYLMSNNVNKYSAGRKAMDLIAAGGSLDEAQSILDNWSNGYVD